MGKQEETVSDISFRLWPATTRNLNKEATLEQREESYLVVEFGRRARE